MPWIERQTASLVYALVDESGSRANISFDVPQDTAADIALTAAGVLRPLIQAVTDCAVVSYSLTYSSFDTTPEAPGANSRVERKGVFQFMTEAGKKVSYQIPGIVDAAVLPDGRVDDDNLAVAALVTAMIAADAIFTDSNGQGLDSLAAAYERYRSTTKRQMPQARRPD